MNFFIYPNLFVMGKLIKFFVSHDVVITINKMFKDSISWSFRNEMQQMMVSFKNWCGLPSIQGAINGTHIYKTKHSKPFLENYKWVQHHYISNNQLQQDIHQPICWSLWQCQWLQGVEEVNIAQTCTIPWSFLTHQRFVIFYLGTKDILWYHGLWHHIRRKGNTPLYNYYTIRSINIKGLLLITFLIWVIVFWDDPKILP